MDLQHVTEIAIAIAQEAGAQVLAAYGSHQGTIKYDGTLVTEADSAAEVLIRRRLKESFPEHAVYGEEMGLEGSRDNPWIWYIDPIDGTSNYVFGIPIWGVSLGLVHDGRPVAGVFDMPPVRQTFWSWEGGGAFCNGRRLSPQRVREMRPTDLISVSSMRPRAYRLGFPQKPRCLGSAAHALAGMAAGQFVGMVHSNWRLHDLAAGLVMCREVGLKITTLNGKNFDSFQGLDPDKAAPALVIAGPELHTLFLQSVQPA